MVYFCVIILNTITSKGDDNMKLEDLRTDSFVLRKLKDSDKKDLLEVLNDSSVQHYIPGLFSSTLEDLHHIYILSNLNNTLLLVIEDISSKKVIGVILAHIDSDLLGYVSYVVHKDFRGKGVMSEALKIFIRYVYINKLARCIQFSVNFNNKSSLQVMNKLHIPFYYRFFHLSLTEELPF